jgi:hypothetical protein
MSEQVCGLLNLSVIGTYRPEDTSLGEILLCFTVDIITYLANIHGV